MAVEQQFYLIFPFVFAVLPSRFWSTGLSLSALLCACVAVSEYGNDLQFYIGTATGFAAIFFGGFVALAQWRSPRFISPSMLLCFGSIWYLGFSASDHYQLAILGGALLFPLMLKVIADQQASGLVNALEWPLLRGLGVISYGFYIYHNLMLFAAAAVTKRIWGIQPQPDEYAGFGFYLTMLIIAYGLTFAISVASYIFIERPVLRMPFKMASELALPDASATSEIR